MEIQKQEIEIIYSPSFVFRRIKEIKNFVDKEEKLEVALSEYCDQNVVLYSNTVLAIEAITMLILPFVRNYQLAKGEVECLILESDWCRFRDNERNPVCIETNGKQYQLTSLLSWIKYIKEVYVDNDAFKTLLLSEKLSEATIENLSQTKQTKTHMKRIAVYGSLRVGMYNHGLLADGHAEHCGSEIIKVPYKMIPYSSFPALIPDTKENDIKFDIFNVDEDTYYRVERLEGYPHFYDKATATDSEGMEVEFYIIPDEQNILSERYKDQENITDWNEYYQKYIER